MVWEVKEGVMGQWGGEGFGRSKQKSAKGSGTA